MQFIQQELASGKRVFVFLGEAGSGKSEIALNWALAATSLNKKVRFFDMDQTKPLFRSRELADRLNQRGVAINVQKQMLDAPIIPPGVFDGLREPDSVVILDVGGDAAGAKCLGQFASAWTEAVGAYLVVNCYRPFSNSQDNIGQTISAVLAASRLRQVSVISNPHFGAGTSLTDIVEGHRRTNELLEGLQRRAELLVVASDLEAAVRNSLPGSNVLGITRHIKPPCELSDGSVDKRRNERGENHG